MWQAGTKSMSALERHRAPPGRRVTMRKVMVVLSVALVALGAGPPVVAEEHCVVKPEHLELGVKLPKARHAIESKKELEIVALGSSSTQGYGASTPFRSYPAELL